MRGHLVKCQQAAESWRKLEQLPKEQHVAYIDRIRTKSEWACSHVLLRCVLTHPRRRHLATSTSSLDTGGATALLTDAALPYTSAVMLGNSYYKKVSRALALEATTRLATEVGGPWLLSFR